MFKWAVAIVLALPIALGGCYGGTYYPSARATAKPPEQAKAQCTMEAIGKVRGRGIQVMMAQSSYVHSCMVSRGYVSR